MATDLDSTVSVIIDTQNASPMGQDFGIPLIVANFATFPERVRTYTTIQQVLADGFAATSAVYRAAAAIFNQSPRPPRLLIGRLDTGSVQVITLTPVVKNTRAYALTIKGTTVSFTSDATATAAEIVTGLIAAVNAAALGVTASGTTTLVLTSAAAGDVFSVAYDKTDFTAQNTTPDTSGIAAGLAAIQAVDDSWYAALMVSWGRAEILAMAAAIESMSGKEGVFVTSDEDILGAGTGDIGSALKALNYTKSSLWFSRNPHQYLNAAILSKMLVTQPGSATWKFKTVAGVAVDTFTPTEIGRLTNKNVNYYRPQAGLSKTAEGVTPSGQFIDVPIFVDWLRNDMQIAIFTALANLPKIPMTDDGIQLIRNAIQGSIKRGIAAGGIDGTDPSAIVINVPRARDLSVADRNARRLTGVNFRAPLAGAVHSVILTGSLV